MKKWLIIVISFDCEGLLFTRALDNAAYTDVAFGVRGPGEVVLKSVLSSSSQSGC